MHLLLQGFFALGHFDIASCYACLENWFYDHLVMIEQPMKFSRNDIQLQGTKMT